jgi:hypothetical protein
MYVESSSFADCASFKIKNIQEEAMTGLNKPFKLFVSYFPLNVK